MPFCSQCGSQVEAVDVFCARCGARQPNVPQRPPDVFSTLSPRTASVLCYIPYLGFLCSIVVLASERFRSDRTVRFHAFQGLYLFVAYLIEDWVFKPMFAAVHHVAINGMIEALLVFVSFFMIIKVSRDETFSL